MGISPGYAQMQQRAMSGKLSTWYNNLSNIDIWQLVKLFLASADELFGPITTVHKNGWVVKKLPWSAFVLDDEDWKRIDEFEPTADLILVCDANQVLHKFLSIKYLNIYHAITAFEALQTAWETKLASNTLHDGLEKLHKYHNKFDQKPAFLLTLSESLQYLPHSLLTVAPVLHTSLF